MGLNNSNAHKNLFKKTNYCSTGMNTVINRLVILGVCEAISPKLKIYVST